MKEDENYGNKMFSDHMHSKSTSPTDDPPSDGDAMLGDNAVMPSATGEASPPENEQGSSKRRDVNRELIDTLERTEEYLKNRDEDGGSSNTDSTEENTIEAPENLSSRFGKMSNTDEDMEVDDGIAKLARDRKEVLDEMNKEYKARTLPKTRSSTEEVLQNL